MNESFLSPGVKLYQHEINEPKKLFPTDDSRPEFAAMEKYCRGLGMDTGCGTNRLSPTVLTTDWYPHTDTDLIWNCIYNGQYFPYPFREDRFDFIFASHVLEDFQPEHLQWVFDEFMRMIKPGGYFVILGPYMDGIRYPKWDEKFTDNDEEVMTGKRQVGETKGNPSHLFDWDENVCHALLKNSKYKIELVQINTLPKNQMTIDFVVRKL